MPEKRAILRRMLDAGRGAWSGVSVDEDAFEAFLGARLDGADAALLHAPDLFLACACARGDAQAMAAFEARYIGDVPSFLARVEKSPAVLDEVKQALRELLFVGREGGAPKIVEYSGRGALGSWLRVVALRTHANLRRKDKAHDPIDEEPEVAIPAADPELALARARYKDAFDQALRDAFKGLSARDRSLCRMHFLDGLNVDKLAAVFNVHRATAARWLAAAREELVDATMALLRQRLKVSGAELESLVGAFRSGLDISLRGLLRSEPA